MRAAISVRKATDDVIFITDDDGDMSITNDAEDVTKACQELWPEKRFVYLDTDEEWWELQHIGGQFTGFALWTGETPQRS